MTPARAALVVAGVLIGPTGQFDTDIGRELHSDGELAVRTINEWAQARLAAQPRPDRQPPPSEGAARTRGGVPRLRIERTRGHAGNRWNERADQLANDARITGAGA